MMQIAVQLYTLRELTKTGEGLNECLRRCKEIGYDGVQLSAVGSMAGESPEVSPEQAKAWLDEYELECCATHVGWGPLSSSPEKMVEYHQTLGCSYVAVPSIGNEFGFEPQDYREFITRAAPLAECLAAYGIKFGYHNHSHEFSRDPFSERPCLEILSDPRNDWLEMEVDTYWVADAGVCPADFLEKCRGRIWAVHVKDREIVPKEGPVMAPVGEGNLNWQAILSACKEGGTQWLIVEQDVCRRDPFSCLESSWEFLTRCLCV